MKPAIDMLITEITFQNERIAELEHCLGVIRSQLFDRDNRETLLTEIIDNTLKN